LAKPNGCSYHQNIGVEQPTAELRPSIALALIGEDPWFDVMIDCADDLSLGPEFREFAHHLAEQDFGRGRFFAASAFQRAVERSDLQMPRSHSGCHQFLEPDR
jgi:hypothetical protein